MSDNTPPHMPDSFEDAERFKRLFVDPAVQAMGQQMEAQLAPILSGQRKIFARQAEQDEKIKAVEARTDKLEKSQNKALIGWGVFSVGIAAFGSAIWDYFRTKLFGAK